MKIEHRALISSTCVAILVFVFVDVAVEFICNRITGVSLLQIFEQKLSIQYSTRFHLINIFLFSAEILLA